MRVVALAVAWLQRKAMTIVVADHAAALVVLSLQATQKALVERAQPMVVVAAVVTGVDAVPARIQVVAVGHHSQQPEHTV
jgi:hypothetical protein